jgi:hypothetical protein
MKDKRPQVGDVVRIRSHANPGYWPRGGVAYGMVQAIGSTIQVQINKIDDEEVSKFPPMHFFVNELEAMHPLEFLAIADELDSE